MERKVSVDAHIDSRVEHRVAVDAELEDARVMANKRFREKLELQEMREGIRYLAAKGRVQVDKEIYTVSTGQRRSENVLKRWRRENPGISGRQFRKLRKRLRRLAKSRAVKSMMEGTSDAPTDPAA